MLIRHALKPPTTKGGIHIPEQYRGEAQEGIVVQVSKGWWEPGEGWVPIDEIKPGDRVIFEKRSGQVVQVGESMLRCIHARDVLAKVAVGQVTLCPMCGGMGVSSGGRRRSGRTAR